MTDASKALWAATFINKSYSSPTFHSFSVSNTYQICPLSPPIDVDVKPSEADVAGK